MEKRISLNCALFIFAVSTSILAVPPNFVQTTTYGVDSAGNNIVSVDYSDGLGRAVQTKLKLPDTTKARVACTYYDEAGRPSISTKTFVDSLFPQEYLPGDIIDVEIKNQLEKSNLNDIRAFSETQYWDDPLGRAKIAIGPGAAYAGNTIRSWTFGVGMQDISFVFSTYTAVFDTGFIVSTITEPMLDSMTNFFLNNNGFPSPQYFLIVSKDEAGVFSQELKDLFGRTMKTRNRTSLIGGQTILPEYRHDILGNVLKENPPKVGLVKLLDSTEYRYNTLGQLIWKRSPDAGEYTYEYNPDGSLSKSILWIGGTKDWATSYEYDSLGRQIAIKRLFSSAAVSVVNNYYDEFSSAVQSLLPSIPAYYYNQTSNLKGRLAASIANNDIDGGNIYVGQVFFYDDEGRIIRKLLAISGSPEFQQTDYEYDIHGKVTKEYFYYASDRLRKKYTYDRLGRMEKVIQSVYKTGVASFVDTELVHYYYDDLGKIKNKRFSAITPGMYQVADTYDIRDRLTNFSSSGTKGFKEIIRYTANGNIDSAKYIYKFGGTLDTTYNCSYTYDMVNRLTAATTNNGVSTQNNSYDYDEVGRIYNKQEKSSNLTDYLYYSQSNRLQKTSKNALAGKEYIYDKYGNLVVDFTKKMVIQYNWRNQPILFHFYDSLSKAGLTFNATTGIYNGSIDLYKQLDNKANANIIVPLSKVKMLYDASGNRVCKMEVQE